MTDLSHIAAKPTRVIVGLMTGTSVDAIDAVVARIQGCGPDTEFDILAHAAWEYPRELQTELLALCLRDALVEDMCRANFALGEVLAEAALAAIERAHLEPREVDLIASHGQTIRHLPEAVPPATLQIGEPAVIAQRTGITTVADFRPGDMAAGGQGAPLVPLADLLLFAHPECSRLMLNIGGIANVTVLPAGAEPEPVRAFDLGPGNCLIDGAVHHFTGGSERFDRDGLRAAAGAVDEQWVARLLQHEFLHRPPPKSTGREEFGAELLGEVLGRGDLRSNDAIATLTAFTVAAIAGGIRRFGQTSGSAQEMWVSGGGARNTHLMALLQEALPELVVRPIDGLGVSAEAKEALCFAVLANETAMGRSGNLPSATGAGGPAVLGKICLALERETET